MGHTGRISKQVGTWRMQKCTINEMGRVFIWQVGTWMSRKCGKYAGDYVGRSTGRHLGTIMMQKC